jgi:hypothetical protein
MGYNSGKRVIKEAGNVKLKHSVKRSQRGE